MFGRKKDPTRMDLWRIQDQILSDGNAILLTDKNVYPLKLMYITDDVMDGGTLQIDKILAKYGYKNLDIKSFDGYLITGVVKGHYLYGDQVIDFKEINGLK